jgi:hypothetical protein
MPSNRKGHFVQVHRDRWDPSKGPKKWVEVLGRTICLTADPASTWWAMRGGWQNVSRECTKRRAKQIAKEYRRAGFTSRVVISSNAVMEADPEVIAVYKKKSEI